MTAKNRAAGGSIRPAGDIERTESRPTMASPESTQRIQATKPGNRARTVVDVPRLRECLTAHFGIVWRSLRRWGVPVASVDDAAQHVFLVFADRLHDVVPGRERAFLLSTAVRVAANARRRSERSREVPSDDLDAEMAAAARHDTLQGATPEQLLDWKERRGALDRALGELPFEQRTVFVLFELEGFSLPEIAEALGVPLGTATSRLRRARHAFEQGVERRSREEIEP
jgi:RNA polymerase sigma-70 factor (ECF subfamily)